MRIPTLLLALSAMVATTHQPLLAQGVFTPSTQLKSATDSQFERKDTARSFPITYLDGPGMAAERPPVSAPAKISFAGKVPDPVKDSLQFLRFVDSLASLRVHAIRVKEAGSAKGSSERDRSLNRLRDVPSILPFYVSSSSASRLTGRVRTRMSSGFGKRQHPVLGGLVSHAGIDLPAAQGTLVYATADGYCRQLINQPDGIGLAIYLAHGRGHQTLYGHLLSTRIKPGQFVLRGQVIGRVGASGMTTGPHLHYGVRYNGQPVDPLPYCFLLSKTAKPTAALTHR